MARKKDYVTSRKADKQRKAKKPGKRKSAEGNTYWESRKNRADVNPLKKLSKGGIMKNLTKKVSLKQIFSGNF